MQGVLWREGWPRSAPSLHPRRAKIVQHFVAGRRSGPKVNAKVFDDLKVAKRAGTDAVSGRDELYRYALKIVSSASNMEVLLTLVGKQTISAHNLGMSSNLLVSKQNIFGALQYNLFWLRIS